MSEIKKEYLNIWEQVEKNKEDILAIIRGAKTLADFGIKVVGFVTSEALLPDPTTYQGDFGDAYAIGDDPDEPPFDYYVFTRPFQGEVSPQWFNIGEFPKAGPQGETGAAGRGIVSIAMTGRAGLTDTYTITYTDGTTSTYEIKNGAKGDTGVITGATASVDNSVGTPSVTVQNLGTPEQRSFNFEFHNLKGVQGEKGDPAAFFILAGQVANSSLLPDADSVDANKAYLVGASAPYDVYAILSVGSSHYWINLGPVAVQQSDTKVGALTFSSTGTLPAEVLDEIVNTTTADFLKIGDRYFVKQSTGYYYALKRDSGEMLVYALDIDLSTGAWEITTEIMVDLDSAQTITGVKTFSNGIVISSLTNPQGTGAFVFGSGIIYTNLGIRPAGNNQTDLGTSSYNWKDLYLSGTAYTNSVLSSANSFDIKGSDNTAKYRFTNNFFESRNDNTVSLGESDKRWKDLYLSGAINKNSSNYGLTLPDTTSWTSNKTIATIGDVLSNPMTTQGDIIYGGASGTPTRLGIGDTYGILRTNSTGTAPEYKKFYRNSIHISKSGASTSLDVYFDYYCGQAFNSSTYTNFLQTMYALDNGNRHSFTGYGIFSSELMIPLYFECTYEGGVQSLKFYFRKISSGTTESLSVSASDNPTFACDAVVFR